MSIQKPATKDRGDRIAVSISEAFIARCIPVPLQMALSDGVMKQLKGDVEEAVMMAIQSLYSESDAVKAGYK